MDAAVLVAILGLLYLAPLVIVVLRRPTMIPLILTLDLLLGWTVIGWVTALLFSLAFPRRRGRRQAPLQPSIATGRNPASSDFARDPLTVGVLTVLAPVVYEYWWFWQFFKLAQREQFARARSFWWIFAPIYCYEVMFRMFDDLEQRLPPESREGFSARTAVAMIIAANLWAGSSILLREPFGLGFLVISLAFLGAATSIVQGAANRFLLAAYPERPPRSLSLGEVTAVVLGVTILGLDLVGATREIAIQTRPASLVAATPALPTPVPTPTPAPTPPPTPFPASRSTFEFSSDAGDFIGQGVTKTFDQSNAGFTDITRAMQFPSVAVRIDTPESAAGKAQGWWVVFAPPAGRTLGPGTYADAKHAGFNGQAPGIDIHGEGRDCADISGTFTIARIVLDANGNLRAMEATFVERCNSYDGPAFRGHLHFER